MKIFASKNYNLAILILMIDLYKFQYIIELVSSGNYSIYIFNIFGS